MKIASQEKLYENLQRGLQASGALEIVGPVLRARRDTLISQAIADYRSSTNPMTADKALLFVAALVENQRLTDDLMAIETDGQRAGQKLQVGS